MKKILVVLFIAFSIILTSCSSKTHFEDLSEERKEEIVNYTMGIMDPELGKAMQMAFDFSLSEEERDLKMKEFEENIEKIFEEKIKTKYPDVIFGDYDDFNNSVDLSDNSRSNEKEKIVKEYTKVKLGDFHEFEKAENEKIQIKVNDIVWMGKTYEDIWEYNAKDEFLFIRLEGINSGKKPVFKWLGDVKLITKDGYEFNLHETKQNPDNLKEGYSGCISCELNPLGKAEQYVIFDIPKIDLAGAMLRFESNLIDFEL